MATTTTDHALMPNEDCVVQRLRERGTSSLENVPLLTRLDGVTTFAFIDRLSRTGSVVLKRNEAEYRVPWEQRT